VQGAAVRFRVEAVGAAAVAVVGSWNDWAPPGEALRLSTQPGIWELTLPLPPGAHRYHFVVDGGARRPPEAPRYVADDFGSEDGVVDVAEAAPDQPRTDDNAKGQ
jgi:1,4-alpha-glucan branching enzyme